MRAGFKILLTLTWFIFIFPRFEYNVSLAAKVMSRTDLHEAVENGDVEGVDLLLQRSTDEVPSDTV